MSDLARQYKEKIIPEMKKKFGYDNDLAVPRIVKVVVSSGTGSIKDEAKKENIRKSLALITGQKPIENKARKSIASFKTRKGAVIGYSATLRGKRMYDFLERLVKVAIPRVRDFRGIDPKNIDSQGNLNIGFREHIVFPEVSDQDVRESFGLGVTVVTTAKTKEEAIELLKLFGFPFKK